MLLHVDPDECLGGVHIRSGHFSEHDLDVVCGHPDFPVGLCEDSVRSTEADVGLEYIVDD